MGRIAYPIPSWCTHCSIGILFCWIQILLYSPEAQSLSRKQCPRLLLPLPLPFSLNARTPGRDWKSPLLGISLLLPAACVFLFHSQDNSLGVTSCINNMVYCKFAAETVSFGPQESTDLFGLLCSFLLSLSQQSLAFGNGNCLLSDHCLKMGFKTNSPLDPRGPATAALFRQ